jgi:hypothetical protein
VSGVPVAPGTFLAALFPDLPPGLIEVRVIEDKPGGELVDRRWYDSPDELVEDIPRLNELAATRNAGVFLGVLPRRERGKGAKADVLPGSAVCRPMRRTSRRFARMSNAPSTTFPSERRSPTSTTGGRCSRTGSACSRRQRSSAG